jgi:hypothetical protein
MGKPWLLQLQKVSQTYRPHFARKFFIIANKLYYGMHNTTKIEGNGYVLRVGNTGQF